MVDTDDSKTIQAVQTTFDIIELLEYESSLSLAEITDRLDYSQSTIYYYLHTLTNRDAVVRTAEGYELGPVFLRLGQRVQDKNDIWSVGRSHVDELAVQSGYLACIAVEFDGKAVIAYIESGESYHGESIEIYRGMEIPLHASAYGRAILAAHDDERIESYFADNDVPDEHQSVNRYRSIRDDGFAFSDGSWWEGTRSIATSVVDDGDTVLGSVGVTGPTGQIENPNEYAKERRFVAEIPELVRRTASAIEAAL